MSALDKGQASSPVLAGLTRVSEGACRLRAPGRSVETGAQGTPRAIKCPARIPAAALAPVATACRADSATTLDTHWFVRRVALEAAVRACIMAGGHGARQWQELRSLSRIAERQFIQNPRSQSNTRTLIMPSHWMKGNGSANLSLSRHDRASGAPLARHHARGWFRRCGDDRHGGGVRPGVRTR
jgi:hypothetical protein